MSSPNIDFVSDDSINWTHHWVAENPPDRKDFDDAKAFDYTVPYLPPAPFSVLEIGCGMGVWATNWKLVGGVYSGLDASADGIRLARQNHPGLTFYFGLAQKMVFRREFAVIFTHAFLQHTNRATKSEIFTRVWAALKPDGVMVLQENLQNGLTATTFTLAGWIEFIEAYGFKYVGGSNDQRNGMVYMKV